MVFHQNNPNGLANSEDPDQTAPLQEQSDQGLHCLPLPICQKFRIITICSLCVMSICNFSFIPL